MTCRPPRRRAGPHSLPTERLLRSDSATQCTVEQMPPTLTVADARCELAQRVSGGVEVTLFWSAADGSTTIEVWQPATGELLVFPVAADRALDAYYHPFAHLPRSSDDLIPVLDA